MTVTNREKREIYAHSHPFRAKCERIEDGQQGMCHFNQVFKTQDLAEWADVSHTHPLPPTEQPTEHGMTIGTEFWERLDEVVDDLKKGDLIDPSILENLKGEARGIAWCLQRLQRPYYETVAAVSRESLERWKMRQHQIPFRQTPGYKFSPLPGAPGYPGRPSDPPATYTQPHNAGTGSATPVAAPARVAGRRATAAAKAAPKQLSEADQKSIRDGIAAGMFKPEDFARVFGVPVEQIRLIASS